MYPDILHHIERLQVELASADPTGKAASVSAAVAQIAAELRGVTAGSPLVNAAGPLTNGEYTPGFLQ